MQHFLVVDDHALVRTGLVLTLQSLDATAVVFEACDINEAMAVIKAQATLDLVILDLRLPVIGGMAGLSLMMQARSNLRIVIITAQYTERDVTEALDRGARGFVSKSYSSQQISQALVQVLQGKLYRPGATDLLDTIPAALMDSGSLPLHADSTQALLTDRQMQVLALLVQGKPNKIIADELGMASGTVKIHISSLMRALNVRNRTQAVLAAAKLGLRI